jgi:hypothetical protein
LGTPLIKRGAIEEWRGDDRVMKTGGKQFDYRL